ncbi:MAG: UDP-N-acetylmuramate--L-alanine ligase [Sedimentisphaerales bacterium]|nr:UDP-N-acetylmuramate--L-alanine ligase [Sedimentisphaerales bacterium]
MDISTSEKFVMTSTINNTRATAAGIRIEPIRQVVTTAKSYHFIGIGGCGMSGLAQVLMQQGHRVSGSDMQDSELIGRLSSQGADVWVGHDVRFLPEKLDCVVISAAVKESNPELQAVRKRHARVIKYAQLLGELSGMFTTMAIAGTHGKSTTSAWTAWLLQRAGLSPSFVIGADVPQLGGGSGAGRGEHLVVEACEYDRSFLQLKPTVAAILNIEADHLDYYRDLDEIISAFGDFAELVGPTGLLVVNADDPGVKRALAGRHLRCETFALGARADWRAENLRYEEGHGCFELVHGEDWIGQVRLSLPGWHNVANALAVAAMARSAGLEDEAILAGLADFQGAGRRMTLRADINGVKVIDDYGHHPTEIRTTLTAIRDKYHPRRLWCIFQPHQHSRTRFLLNEFALSFATADVVLLPEIYFVRDSEALRREINAEQLAEKIREQGGNARFLGEFEAIVDHLAEKTEPGDVIVTMGAGDVWKIADEYIRRFS